MKASLPLLAVALLTLPATARAQSVTDPRITSWVTVGSAKYARVFETSADKSSGNAVSTWPRLGLTNGGGGQATAAYSDVQRVVYSNTYVYITTTGLPSYTMGQWLTPNGGVYTSWPTNRGAIHRIPRTPSIPTTKQKTNGSGGVLVNGVFVWANGDAQSYNTSTGVVSMQGGQGIWNRLAGVAEAFNFDPAYGHQPNNGAYHNHVNPIALRYQLGDSVTYNASTKTYTEASPSRHSPLIGWANDGLPIYGPYGYSSAMDASSGVRRMTTGFQKRDGTNGTTNLASTGRTTLPVWAAGVQGKSQTLAATEYGPTTTATYQVAPGVTGTYSLGIFAEDYEYLGDVGKTQGVDFDLNRQNVRFCVTPEFPSGTYAYFVALDASGNTVFPDIINQEFFGTAPQGQGTVTSISESVTEYLSVGPAAAITVTATASGSGVALAWNSAEGATYRIESSADNATWSTVAASVSSGGTATNYTAGATASYFRVTLTAIATYDTSGTSGTPVGKTGTVSFGAAATAPSITTQPTASSSIATGGSVTLSVAASGTGTLSYQWRKDGNAIAGATSSTYTISNATSAAAGSYTVVVTNAGGSTTSNAAVVTVGSTTSTAPTILAQPSSATVTPGTTVTLTVAASGSGTLTYQWFKDGAALSGATSATLTLSNAQTTANGAYTVTVTNSAGSTTSSAASVLVTTNTATVPSLSQQPASVSVVAGATATFNVSATGSGTLTYQWTRNGAPIAGATSATYTITNAQLSAAGSYAVIVTGSAGGVISAPASLTVTSAAVGPSISTQPVHVTVTAGNAASFTVVADGTGPLIFQWSRNGIALAGATSATLTIANAQSGDAGTYAVAIANSVGTITSGSATLTVNAPVVVEPPKPALPGARIINLALRARVGGAAGQPTMGFVLQGSGAGKRVIMRAVGPTLGGFGLGGALADPRLQLWSSGAMLAANDNWQAADAAAFTAVGAFPLGAGAADAAIVSTLAPGAYTTPVLTNGETSGIALVECYDGAPDDLNARLVNASALAFGGTGEDVLIPGFVISGEGSVRVLVRAVGPGLAAFGLPSTMSDPQISLFRNGTVVASNNDWATAANATDVVAATSSVGAFALSTQSNDAALLVTLTAGAYTANVSPTGAGTGMVLVEIYVVP